MLTSRGQENLVHARPAAGKALLPKTPSNFQTPRTTNRAPLGAKTTNAKAQTIQKDKKDAKLQVFKTPAPKQQHVQPERIASQLSTTRRSARSKITVASAEPTPSEVLHDDLEDDGPDFGYAPPPIVELPDPPIEFDYDQTFPQFRPENMFRGYGEIYHASPKDENGFSIRLKQEEEEHRQYQKHQEDEFTRKAIKELSKPLILLEDEFDLSKPKIRESKIDTIKARSAVSALSGIKAPSVANKQTTSSRLKMSKPVHPRTNIRTIRSDVVPKPRPLAVSKNTIGFPKAKKPISIIPQRVTTAEIDNGDMDTLADDLSDFEFSPPTFEDDEDVFQLPMPE